MMTKTAMGLRRFAGRGEQFTAGEVIYPRAGHLRKLENGDKPSAADELSKICVYKLLTYYQRWRHETPYIIHVNIKLPADYYSIIGTI